MTSKDARYHSSDDMDGLRELAGVDEPVAVVIRPDGSVDAYGYIGIVDRRPDNTCECGQNVAALPLAVRAPEIAQLAAMLPAGEWGADELGTVSNWLNGLGFDTTGDAEPFHADCACCMSGCNGGEPGTRCGNCHHVETGR